jgi:hypothetical protein
MKNIPSALIEYIRSFPDYLPIFTISASPEYKMFDSLYEQFKNGKGDRICVDAAESKESESLP